MKEITEKQENDLVAYINLRMYNAFGDDMYSSIEKQKKIIEENSYKCLLPAMNIDSGFIETFVPNAFSMVDFAHLVDNEDLYIAFTISAKYGNNRYIYNEIYTTAMLDLLWVVDFYHKYLDKYDRH